MLQRFVLSLSLSALLMPFVGCGPDTGTTYDAASAPPVTQDEIKAREDYEAQRKKEQQEQYGS